jgi:hypothetical protein
MHRNLRSSQWCSKDAYTDGARSDRAAGCFGSAKDQTENLLRQLLAARSGRRSEQIIEEQLALFEAELKVRV